MHSSDFQDKGRAISELVFCVAERVAEWPAYSYKVTTYFGNTRGFVASLSWIFKLFSHTAANASTDTTASAANKT